MPQAEIWEHYQNESAEAFSGAKWRLDYLLSYAERFHPRIVLNIGCGDGYIEREALKRSWDAYSVDPDQRAIARLKSEGINACVGFIENLPLPDESMDVVFCSEVLEHLTNGQLAAGLPEIRRVLRGGGVLIGTTPYREHLPDNEFVCSHCGVKTHRWGHQQSFNEIRMRALLAEHLTILKIAPKYFPQWNTNWKGKLFNIGMLALAMCGSHGRGSNLFFAASKT